MRLKLLNLGGRTTTRSSTKVAATETKERVRFFLGRLRKKFIPIKLVNLNKNRLGSVFAFAKFEQTGWMDKAEERCKEKGDILNLKNIMC